jgi:hypothetical protein
MADLRDFNALFDEHGAEPAMLLFREKVIVRGYRDGDESVRLIIQNADNVVTQQLLVPRQGLQALATGEATFEDCDLFVDAEQPAIRVTVTGFHDDAGVRLTVDEAGPLEEQLVIPRNAVLRLAEDPQDPPHQT